jgi:hypothetical protein
MIYFASQAGLKGACRSFWNELWKNDDQDPTLITVNWDKFNEVRINLVLFFKLNTEKRGISMDVLEKKKKTYIFSSK